MMWAPLYVCVVCLELGLQWSHVTQHEQALPETAHAHAFDLKLTCGHGAPADFDYGQKFSWPPHSITQHHMYLSQIELKILSHSALLNTLWFNPIQLLPCFQAISHHWKEWVLALAGWERLVTCFPEDFPPADTHGLFLIGIDCSATPLLICLPSHKLESPVNMTSI